LSPFVTFALIPQWLRLRNLAARQRSIGRGVSSARKYTAMKKTSCPAESKRTDAGVGYKTVAEIITGFIQLNQLPESLSSLVGFWDDGDGIYETFVRHRALWHVSCKQRLVHGTKLDRLRSRIADTGDAELATDADNSEEAGDVSCSKIHARRSLSTVGGTHTVTQWPINPPLLSSSHSPSFSPPRNGVKSHSRCGTES